jgi:hypothetical protein
MASIMFFLHDAMETIDGRRASKLYGKIDKLFIESFGTRYAKCILMWSTCSMPIMIRRHPCGDVSYYWIARSAKLSNNKQFVYTQRFNSCLYHDINDFHVFERAYSGDLIWHLLGTFMRGKWLHSNTFQQKVTRERAHRIIGHSDLQL